MDGPIKKVVGRIIKNTVTNFTFQELLEKKQELTDDIMKQVTPIIALRGLVIDQICLKSSARNYLRLRNQPVNWAWSELSCYRQEKRSEQNYHCPGSGLSRQDDTRRSPHFRLQNCHSGAIPADSVKFRQKQEKQAALSLQLRFHAFYINHSKSLIVKVEG